MAKQITVLVLGAQLPDSLPAICSKGPTHWELLPTIQRQVVNFTAPNLEAIDWIVFSSQFGVDCFKDIKIPNHTKLAAIGKATAQATHRTFGRCDFYPKKAGTEGFLQDFPASSGTLLLPGAAKGRKTLEEYFKNTGDWKVQALAIYATVPNSLLTVSQRRDALERANYIIVASPSSAVEELKNLQTPIFCLGHYTWRHLKNMGIQAQMLSDSNYASVLTHIEEDGHV